MLIATKLKPIFGLFLGVFLTVCGSLALVSEARAFVFKGGSENPGMPFHFQQQQLPSSGIGLNGSTQAAGDLNGDGCEDKAKIEPDGTVSVQMCAYNSSGSVEFQPPKKYSIAVGSSPTAAWIVDMSGDGKPDIVTNNTAGTKLSVLTQTSQGSFTLSLLTVGSPTPQMMIKNLDGDTNLRPDIAFSSQSNNSVSISIWFRTSEQLSSPNAFNKKSFQPPGPITGAVFEDINADGRGDFIAVYNSSTPGEDGVSVMSLSPSGETTNNFPLGQDGDGPTGGITVNDFNGDGLKDIAVATDYTRIMIRAYGSSFGGQDTFLRPYTPVYLGGGVKVSSGDSDSDGFADLFVNGVKLDNQFLKNKTLPSISGTQRVGEKLKINNGWWIGDGSKIFYVYQWLRCFANDIDLCYTLSGENAAEYTLVQPDAGYKIRAIVTAFDDNALVPGGIKTAITQPLDTVSPAVAVAGKKAAVSVLTKSAYISRKGRKVKVKLRCEPHVNSVCKFALKLTRNGSKVGSRNASLKVGETKTFSITLSKSAAKLIRARKRLSFRTTVVSTDSAGASTTTNTAITVKQPKAKKKKARKKSR